MKDYGCPIGYPGYATSIPAFSKVDATACFGTTVNPSFHREVGLENTTRLPILFSVYQFELPYALVNRSLLQDPVNHSETRQTCEG